MQHDLSQGPVPASPTVLLSFGPIGLAVKQLSASPSIGRVVAISSASTLFKKNSGDSDERALMEQIEVDEQRLVHLCEERNVTLSLFKTTMIYGHGLDANVSRLSALINALPVVPVVGSGLRAPVHSDDLANLVLTILSRGSGSSRVWLLEGGERLTYPNLLRRIVRSQENTVRVARVPLWLMRLALAIAHRFGRLQDVSIDMLARQSHDLVVDDSPAREQLGWNPTRFSP